MRYFVYQMRENELPIFRKAPNSDALVLGCEGENVLQIIKPDRVIFPLFSSSLRDANPRKAWAFFRNVTIKERVQALADVAHEAAEANLVIVAVSQQPDAVRLDDGSVEWSMVCGIGVIRAVPGPLWDASSDTLKVGVKSWMELPDTWDGTESGVQAVRSLLFGDLPERPDSQTD